MDLLQRMAGPRFPGVTRFGSGASRDNAPLRPLPKRIPTQLAGEPWTPQEGFEGNGLNFAQDSLP